MKFLAKIENGQLNLGSEYNKHRFQQFIKKNEGKILKIETTDLKSDKQRGYYFGAVVPAIATHHGSDDFELWHAILKQEFNCRAVKGKTGWKKIGLSTKKLNKVQFGEYLTKVTGWMADNGINIPDPEAYKHYRDNAKLFDELCA